MIESEDAIRVLDTVAKNLLGVAKNASNFDKLPDDFWSAAFLFNLFNLISVLHAQALHGLARVCCIFSCVN